MYGIWINCASAAFSAENPRRLGHGLASGWSAACALPMVLVSYSIPNWYLLGVLATFIGECRKELGQSWDLPRMWTTATFTGLATVSMVMFAGSYVDISATLSPDQSLYWKIAGVIVLAGLGLGASANNPVEALMVR